MAELEPLAEGSAWLGLGLVALRWWALLQVQVLWRRAVGPWWTVVAVGLAVVLALGTAGVGSPGVGAGVGLPGVGVRTAVGSPALDPWLAAAAELALGGLVGLVIALPGHAVLGAARASAQVLNTPPGPWRALTVTLVAATALGLHLHQPLLLGARALVEAWPVGDPAAWAGLDVPAPGRLLHALALLALTLATPALLAGALAELGVRALGRGPLVAGPGTDAAAPWLRTAAALVATGASWAAYDAIWATRALGGP